MRPGACRAASFEGVAGLRKAVLSRPELFVTTVTESFSRMRWVAASNTTTLRGEGDRARRARSGLPVFIDCAGCGERRAVPDAEAAAS